MLTSVCGYYYRQRLPARKVYSSARLISDHMHITRIARRPTEGGRWQLKRKFLRRARNVRRNPSDQKLTRLGVLTLQFSRPSVFHLQYRARNYGSMPHEKCKMQIETESCPGALSDHFSSVNLHFEFCIFLTCKEEPCPPMKRDAC